MTDCQSYGHQYFECSCFGADHTPQVATIAATDAQPIFERHGWVYGFSPERTPTVEELTETIEYLIEALKEDEERDPESFFTATGRWYVWHDKDLGRYVVSLQLAEIPDDQGYDDDESEMWPPYEC